MADYYFRLRLPPNEDKKWVLSMFGINGNGVTFGGGDGKNKTGSGKQS